MSVAGTAEQRRMALHDLIDQIVISREGELDAYRRISLNEGYLRRWFSERPQWQILGGKGVYRLERMPSLVMPERAIPRLRSPLAYACLCWVLWFAETMAINSRDWFVISELADRVMTVAEGRFTLAERSHREALVQALQLLVDLGGLVLRDGDTGRWVSAELAAVGDESEVMYEFADTAPRLLANFQYESIAVAASNPQTRTAIPTGKLVPPLARAWRALLLGPIFWRGDDPEAFAALLAEQERVQRDLETALGWQLRCNSQYGRIWRMTTARHAGRVLLDIYPGPGDSATERHSRFLYHPILLLLGRIQTGVSCGQWLVDADGTVSVPLGEAHDLLTELRGEFRRNWGSELGATSLSDLAKVVFAEMRRIGLMRGPDGFQRCHFLPPAAEVCGYYTDRLTEAVSIAPQDETHQPVQRTLF